MLPALDPVLAHAAAGFLALVFLLGAIDKLAAPAAFEAAVEGYRLVPAALVRATAIALLVLEAAAGLALVPTAGRELGAVLAVGLLATVSGAVAVNLLRGRRGIDCGCGGINGRQPLSWVLVLRNLVLAACAGVASAPVTGRSLSWLDGATVVAASAALLALYATINQLRANAPHPSSLSPEP